MAEVGIAPYNFCVLCATESEMAQCLQVFGEQASGFERQRFGDGASSADHRYKVAANGGHLSLLLTVCGDMGHSEAALRTIDIISKHKPAILVFVGTAASLDPNKYQLGDVVIPRKAGYRRFEKVSERGQSDFDRLEASSKEKFFEGENLLVSTTDTISISPEARGYLANLESLPLTLRGASAASIEIGGVRSNLRQPKLSTDVEIISCGMVVDSISYRDFLKNDIFGEIFRKQAIIDMESYGFLRAIDVAARSPVGHNTIGFLIRGVSDYAGRKQQTEDGSESLPSEWKALSSRNAAYVTREFFKHISSNMMGTPGGSP